MTKKWVSEIQKGLNEGKKVIQSGKYKYLTKVE